MSILVMADNASPIAAERDGALYNSIIGNRNYVVKGIGSELAVTVAGGTYTIGTGEAVICGRHIALTASESISGSGTIALQIDLSTSPPSGSVVVVPSGTPLTQQDLNNGGTKCQMALLNADGTDARKFNSAAVKTYTNIAVAGTPIATAAQSWDTYSEYLYSLNVAISGIEEDDIVLNFAADMSVIENISPVILTRKGGITVYTKDATMLSGNIRAMSVIGG